MSVIAMILLALLLIYPKNEKDDLTADERKVLMQIIERWR